MSAHPLTKLGGKRQQSGFTLLEVLISLGIGLVVMTSLLALFDNTSHARQETEKVTYMTENARYAMGELSSDIEHAGFLGEFNPSATSPSFQTLSVCPATPTTPVTLAGLGWDLGVSPRKIPVALMGFSGSGLACLTDRSSVTERMEGISIHRVDTGSAVVGTARAAADFYLHPSRCAADLVDVDIGAGTTTLALENLDCSAVYPSVRRITQRSYFLSDCNICSPSDGIQTLKRAELVGGVYVVTSVAEGIERMAIEYGLDTTGNGVVDEYKLGSAISGTAPDIWANVVAVRITLLARADVITRNFTDERTYQLAGTSYAPADGYKRILATQTVRVMNAAGRREK